MTASNTMIVFGPPGTGKTTYMTRQVKLAAEKYGKDRIMVASFTRAAAAELQGRDLELPKGQVNTLHAHCYAALGKGDITETLADEWNKYAPMYSLSTNAKAGEFEDAALEGNFKSVGDEYISKMNLYRAKMTPFKMWATNVQAFAQKWNEFKKETESLDFTDLIEWCLHSFTPPPNSPSIGFFDEAQDFTPLELALVRQWGSTMEKVIMCGDDDQVLYQFKGASADAFLSQDIPQENKRVLSQSYRVPRAVLAVADKFIKQIKNREPKVYKPRDYEGEVRRITVGGFKNVEPILLDAKQYLDEGKTVMFLTSCSYMLEPIKAALKEEAIPFHNPYRTKRGDWNPLAPSRGTSASERLLAFLRVDNDVWKDKARMWTGDDIAVWVEHIKAKGIFLRGGKTALEQYSGDVEMSIEELFRFFEEEALGVVLNDLKTTEDRVRWFLDNTLETKKKPFEFPSKLILKRGLDGITDKPKVIIGSIHSVKGGQADVVYLFPDLSLAGMKEYMNPQMKDSVIRQFYVGMTRARETLVFVPSCTPYKVNL